MAIYLNTYYPINHTEYGRNACENFNIHPLEDGSIRREPDFTHQFPAISGLCRPGAMNQLNLQPGDIVIYKTNGSHILSAILNIQQQFDDHQTAAEWFTKNNLSVPTNNITVECLPIHQSHALHFLGMVGRNEKSDRCLTNTWNCDYIRRANNSNSSYFFITEPIYNAVLQNLVPDNYINIAGVIREYYNRIPNTSWRPASLSQQCYDAILQLIPNENLMIP